jgi:predicted Zn-dependent protease
MEREADRIGYGVFQDAGFATPGMATMFEKLDQASRLNDSGGFPYLRSHPLTSERMAEARSRLTEQTQATGERGMLHALMQGRSRVLMDPTVDNWRRLLAQAQAQAQATLPAAITPSATTPLAAVPSARTPPAPPADRAGALYAGALAAARLGDHRTAALLSDELARGFALAPTTPQATAAAALDTLRSPRASQMLTAELALARGEPQAALAALTALTAWPLVRDLPPAAPAATASEVSRAPAGAAGAPAPRADERTLLMLRSQTVLATALQARAQGQRSQDGALREALEALQTWVAEHRQDAAAWLLLAQASDALGLQLRALRAQAEARAAVGDLGAAVDRLRAAQARSRSAAAGGDFIEASIIDTRLRELQAQRRQEAAEMRAQRGPGGPREEPVDDERDTRSAPRRNAGSP